MSAIRVHCQGCGQEVNLAETEDLRCVPCQALQLVADDLRAYGRLWAKFQRYERSGAPTAGPRRQLVRLVERMTRRVAVRIQKPELASDTLRQALAAARQQADSQGGRILVPRLGQEILGAGASA